MDWNGGFKWNVNLVSKLENIPYVKELLKIIGNRKIKLNPDTKGAILFLSGVLFGYLLFYIVSVMN